MNLKEAFNYRNFINANIQTLSSSTVVPEVFCKVKELHQKSKTNKDAEDEERTSENGEISFPKYSVPEELFNVDPKTILVAHRAMCEDLCNLDVAIAEAKERMEYNIDVLISQNKIVMKQIGFLRSVLRIKSSESNMTGSDFKFNNEGVQNSYVYPVKRITTINFDRKKVKKLYDDLTEDMHERSYKIDELMLTAKVDFDPVFRVSDGLEDILKYYSQLKLITAPSQQGLIEKQLQAQMKSNWLKLSVR